jgi:hypothetical protein
MYIVSETMLVTRYHLVSEDSEQAAIESVTTSSQSAEYLESCDELHWQEKIEYAVEPLKEDWRRDLRLKRAARHIEDRLSQTGGESPLTKPGSKPIIKVDKKAVSVEELLKRVK